jgi:hypothetical protein
VSAVTDNTIFVDLTHDDASFIGAVKLTHATRFVQKAAAMALRGLGLPLSSSIAFRRQGRVVRQVQLDYACRENSQ